MLSVLKNIKEMLEPNRIAEIEEMAWMCSSGEDVTDTLEANGYEKEADEYSSENDLALCVGAGSGHFHAEDVLSFHKVREGRYIFEVK